MESPIAALRSLDSRQRIKAALLSGWFFITITTLWLLKPVRVASLLAHLGARETPYVRLAGVATIAVIVMVYTRYVNKLSRLQIIQGTTWVITGLLVAFWAAIHIGGRTLGGWRPFVWAVYILVEIYSTFVVGLFWTYANDVVTSDEANRIYGIVGFGGIIGGIVGGAFVDLFSKTIGSINLLLVCAVLTALSIGAARLNEHVLEPPARHPEESGDHGFHAALGGAIEVSRSRYLLLLVGIVVAYEFTATLTDFSISVIFERTYRDESVLAAMYGRLGWIVSATAIASQVFLVPILLPHKRVALLVPPAAMIIGAIGAFLAPVASIAMFLAATDRGLNYSIQQSTKETLYIPLNDAQKYKAKAFIDIFVDRLAKALAAIALLVVIAEAGLSVRISLYVALVSMVGWGLAAYGLGRHWRGSELVAPDTTPAAVPVPTAAVTPAVHVRAMSGEQTPNAPVETHS